MNRQSTAQTAGLGLTLGALGVVYGDIGTSPLYAFQEIFNGPHALSPSEPHVLGALSLVFWSVLIVVSLKYVVLVLRADNKGEGGTVALMALASRSTTAWPRTRAALVVLGILGAALFYGDGVITPAISVLSAVEGLKVATPAFTPYVVPLTLLILLGLYTVQKHGTGNMGRYFGPVMLVWFFVIGTLGIVQIMQMPSVLKAVDPRYALGIATERGWFVVYVLGSVFLALTGAEALYADMGHFGRSPIRRAWFALVMPGLLLCYFGQGALLLREPGAVENPFFNLAPDFLLYPLVGLACVATVIASQATISGTFSVTKQAIQLGYLPRLRVVHTSVHEAGQIYVPLVNWMQFAAVVFAVAFFGSSSALATAYGIAVTSTMVITTLMTFFVVRFAWKYPWWVSLAATGFFLLVDVAFFSANALKILSGGWFTLALAAALFTIMVTWKEGRDLMRETMREEALPLREFLDSVFISPPMRAHGTAVFMTSEVGVTPAALLHNLKHNNVLHETNLFVTARSHEVPWVGFDKRVELESIGRDCWQVVLNFGFKNDLDVPAALQLLRHRGVDIDEMTTSYFLSRETVVPTVGSGMAPWREKLFAGMHRNAAAAADFLNLPPNRVVELGSKVQI